MILLFGQYFMKWLSNGPVIRRLRVRVLCLIINFWNNANFVVISFTTTKCSQGFKINLLKAAKVSETMHSCRYLIGIFFRAILLKWNPNRQLIQFNLMITVTTVTKVK